MYNYEAGTNTWNPHPDRVEQEDILDVCLSNDAMRFGCTLFDSYGVNVGGARLYDSDVNENYIILPPKYDDMESTSVSISSIGEVFAVSDHDFVCNNGNTVCGGVGEFNATNNGQIDIVND